MALTKADIVEQIADQNGFTKNQSTKIIETLIEIIKSNLESGDDVLVSGFGKFCVRNKNQRRGRNPATGDALMLDSRKVVTFRCSGLLKNRINFPNKTCELQTTDSKQTKMASNHLRQRKRVPRNRPDQKPSSQKAPIKMRNEQ